MAPNWPEKEEIKRTDAAAKQMQAYHYNKRNRVRSLSLMKPGDSVLMKLDNEKQWTTLGSVSRVSYASYVVNTAQGGQYRRKLMTSVTHN